MNEFDTHVRVLAVSPRESETSALAHILGHSAWTLLTAPDVSTACRMLKANHVHVVLCDAKLSDGTWKDVLTAINDATEPPQLIVTAHHADDRLWAEVLNVGAWDVLVKPYHPKEVYRTIHLAWRHWTDHRRVPRRTVSPAVGRDPGVAALAR